MLARLIYRSMSKNPSRVDLSEILSVSRQNNQEVGLTGALCHLRGAYMQYLEGDEAAIGYVMGSIVNDARHCNLTVLEYRFIAARAFPNWSMAMLKWNLEVETALGPLADMGLYGISCATAAPTFRLLTKSSAWTTL